MAVSLPRGILPGRLWAASRDDPRPSAACRVPGSERKIGAPERRRGSGLSRAPHATTLASLDRLDILYVGTLPPQPGGAAVVGAQLLQRLAARGHAVRALAPISSATAPARADLAASLSAVGVTWFPVPRFENAPDVPPDDDFAQAERAQIVAKLPNLIGERRPMWS
jgi:hypothetical protein